MEGAHQEIGVERQNLRAITAELYRAPYNIFQDAMIQMSSILASHFLNFARENGLCVVAYRFSFQRLLFSLTPRTLQRSG